MRLQVFRLLYFLLLIWAGVLFLRQGSFGAVIVPLFVIGFVYILQEFADRHLPGFSTRWRVALLLLTILFTFRTSVLPWLTDHFPAIWGGIHIRQNTVDGQIGNWLNSCPATALQALNNFRGGWAEAEGRQIAKELQDLVSKKDLGVFTEPDRRQYDEALARYQRLIDQDKKLRNIIENSCRDETRVAQKTVSVGDEPSVANSVPKAVVNVNTASTPANHGGTSSSNVFESKQKPGAAPLTFNQDPSIVPGKINTALVIAAPLGPDGFAPSDALYGLLRAPSTNVVLNLFDEQRFKDSGAFAMLYGGDAQPLRNAGALARVDYLVLAKVLYTFSRSPEIDQDLRSCRLTFGYKTFDRKANLIKADSLTTVGAGLSEVAALKTALERLAQGHASAILTGQ